MQTKRCGKRVTSPRLQDSCANPEKPSPSRWRSRPPVRVLDLGCGDGTTAVPLAQLGADVVGIDIARNLVDAGNQRAAAAGLDRLKFQEGDASNLDGVADDSFDLTLSVFGAMFAPKPFDVAREMVRVTKPGGRIVMGNWIPNDPTFVAQLLKISSAFLPPPPEGFVSPMTWGVDDPHHRAFRPGRRACREHLDGQRHVRLRLSRQGSGAGRGLVPPVLWPHDERLRSGSEKRKRAGAARPAYGTGEEPEHELQRRHVHPSDVSARDGSRLKKTERGDFYT